MIFIRAVQITIFLLISHLFNSQERNVLNYVNDLLGTLRVVEWVALIRFLFGV